MSNSVFFENRELPDQFAVGASRVRSSHLDVDLAPVSGEPDRLDYLQASLKISEALKFRPMVTAWQTVPSVNCPLQMLAHFGIGALEHFPLKPKHILRERGSWRILAP